MPVTYCVLQLVMVELQPWQCGYGEMGNCSTQGPEKGSFVILIIDSILCSEVGERAVRVLCDGPRTQFTQPQNSLAKAAGNPLHWHHAQFLSVHLVLMTIGHAVCRIRNARIICAAPRSRMA